MDIKETKRNIIQAGKEAVDELIKVAKSPILAGNDDDPEPEKLKQAAATKKLAIFDAFEILNRIEEEERMLEEGDKESTVKPFKGFAEGRSR